MEKKPQDEMETVDAERVLSNFIKRSISSDEETRRVANLKLMEEGSSLSSEGMSKILEFFRTQGENNHATLNLNPPPSNLSLPSKPRGVEAESRIHANTDTGTDAAYSSSPGRDDLLQQIAAAIETAPRSQEEVRVKTEAPDTSISEGDTAAVGGVQIKVEAWAALRREAEVAVACRKDTPEVMAKVEKALKATTASQGGHWEVGNKGRKGVLLPSGEMETTEHTLTNEDASEDANRNPKRAKMGSNYPTV